ncbi:ROK family transcriptional regulator [Microbacterium sp. NPDC019599]|uniref:ROK family transcriptional regulator n=1 Tax=Microbacterium sp. NPDC019599 TaxID=3154690 RepID=UPI0033CDA8A4
MADGAISDATTITLGATIDDVRRQNLSQVLRLVHRDGPHSRSDLTRATGLNRSTVGGLVLELSHRGLVDENDSTGPRRVGRPSPTVSASDQTTAIAVNPEIDAIDVALVGLSGAVLQRVRYRNERVPTVSEFVNIVSALTAGMRPYGSGRQALGIGVAIPGLVREADGTVILAPHLGWQDAPIGRMITDATGYDVVIGNDANCGVIAENTFGAGRGDGVVIYLNGGASGIGGGIVINNRLIAGEGGNAGEFGHTVVTSVGRRCHCGSTGCLETEVRRERLLSALSLMNTEPDDLLVAMELAWLDRRSVGRREMERQLSHLGVALRSIINVFNPRRVILGGYLAQLLAVVGEHELRGWIAPTLPGASAEPDLVGTGLADALLLIGAAELVFAPALEDPTRVAER